MAVLDGPLARSAALREWMDAYSAIYDDYGSDPRLTELREGGATRLVRMMISGRDPVPNVRILLVGEAPGADEDRTGWPFVGRSGQLLDRILREEAGLERSEVYVTNLVKYRPVDPEGRNRSPRGWETEASLPYLVREIELVDPAVVVTLGRYSTAAVRVDVTLGEVHGRSVLLSPDNTVLHALRGRVHLPAYHPSYALRDRDNERALRADLRPLRAMLAHARAALENS
jgi:uracil-DNA glycosylase